MFERTDSEPFAIHRIGRSERSAWGGCARQVDENSLSGRQIDRLDRLVGEKIIDRFSNAGARQKAVIVENN